MKARYEVTTCKDCGDEKLCNIVTDPYLAELYGEDVNDVKVPLCDECYESALLDI